MSIPTVGEVKTDARGLVGDAEVAGGQVYTNTYLQQFLARAYSELFRAFDENNVRLVNRYMHYDLPAFQTTLFPAAAGVANFGQPINIRHRASTGTVDITSITAGAPANDFATVVTAAVHGLSTGNRIVIYGALGISDDVNDQWHVDVSDTTTFTLLGCRAVGTHTASSGVVAKSDAEWSRPVQLIDDASRIAETADATGLVAAWQGNAFRFNVSSQIRQLRVWFSLSGSAPSADGDSIGIDDSLDFLSERTAGLAAFTNGADSLAAKLESRAVGSQMQLDMGDPGGTLGAMIRLGVQSMAGTSYRTRRFRPKRNMNYVVGRPG